ncbi:ATP-grasp domain-containing protein [Hahella ganghwensis]|uniref:ATP-grasp domain-containing protein n=1 Tax=Hahella ganghwensis TaxID=286420 RepID=UPI0003619411|nr:ATP-grasp domain-containing protein [Hahella ganghwensis]
MTTFLLAPPKVLIRWSESELDRALDKPVCIVTSDMDDSTREKLKAAIGRYSESLYEFGNYNSSSTIPLRLLQLAQKERASHIVAMSEVDVMRSARLRDHLGLVGLKADQALFFRDKAMMKKQAAKEGIKVAKHSLVYDPLTLLNATEELGYPVVIKPPMGRGSSGVNVVQNRRELEDFLTEYRWNDLGAQVPLLVEEYIEGDLYRIDGVVHNGKVCFSAAAKYWGTHLNYLGGGCLGSVMLDPKAPLAKDLTGLTERLLLEVLPFAENGSFHVEVFKNSDGELVFSEAAARLGGGSIIEEVETSYGVNIKSLTLAAECGNDAAVAEILGMQHSQFVPAAQLHISPKAKTLVSMPAQCEFPYVSLCEFQGQAGDNFQLMTHTNSEIARFVLKGESPEILEQRLQELVLWFEEQCQWT